MKRVGRAGLWAQERAFLHNPGITHGSRNCPQPVKRERDTPRCPVRRPGAYLSDITDINPHGSREGTLRNSTPTHGSREDTLRISTPPTGAGRTLCATTSHPREQGGLFAQSFPSHLRRKGGFFAHSFPLILPKTDTPRTHPVHTLYPPRTHREVGRHTHLQTVVGRHIRLPRASFRH